MSPIGRQAGPITTDQFQESLLHQQGGLKIVTPFPAGHPSLDNPVQFVVNDTPKPLARAGVTSTGVEKCCHGALLLRRHVYPPNTS